MPYTVVTELYKVRHFYDTPAEYHTSAGDFTVSPDAQLWEVPDEGPVELTLDDLGRVIDWSERAYSENWL